MHYIIGFCAGVLSLFVIRLFATFTIGHERPINMQSKERRQMGIKAGWL